MKHRWFAIAVVLALGAVALVAAGGFFESGAKRAAPPEIPPTPAATPEAPTSASAPELRTRESERRREPEASPEPKPEPEIAAVASPSQRFLAVRALDARTGEALTPFRVTLRFLSANGPGKELRTAASGEDPRAPERRNRDEVAVRYDDLGGGPFVAEVTRMGYRTAYAPAPHPLPSDADPEPFTVSLARLGTLEGRALSAKDGQPIPYALVTLVRDPPRPKEIVTEQRSLSTTWDGAFRFRGIDTGRYRLEVHASGFQDRTSDPLELGGIENDVIGIEVRLAVAGRIVGKLRASDGRTIAPTDVLLLAREGDRAVGTKRTRVDGAYEFDGLAPGDYRLAVGERRFDVTVRDGEVTPFDIVLDGR